MKVLDRELLQSPSALNRFGAMIVPGRLSGEQVKILRDKATCFPGRRLVQIPEIAFITSFWEMIFLNSAAHRAIRKVLGEYCLLPSFQLQRNSFTQANINSVASGLHIDCPEELFGGAKYLLTSGAAWINIGFYLQDYTHNGHSGGIAIIPRSHKLMRSIANLPYGHKIAAVVLQFLRKFTPDIFISKIPTKAGDFLLFDSRIIHCSVPAKTDEQDAIFQTQAYVRRDGEDQKFAFYFFASRTASAKNTFKNNFLARVAREGVTPKHVFSYSAAVSLDQSEYPKIIQDGVRKLGTTIVTRCDC